MQVITKYCSGYISGVCVVTLMTLPFMIVVLTHGGGGGDGKGVTSNNYSRHIADLSASDMSASDMSASDMSARHLEFLANMILDMSATCQPT